MPTGVATYYDRLGRWNRVARAIGYGGGSSALTVHRALADPRAGGRPTFSRLHDVILERLPPMHGPRVLDAGCGLGGTMLALAERLDSTCTGLTLSRSQAEVANRMASQRGRAAQVHALVQSYDDPPAGPFDLVVAIESLAHSPDPGVSVRALAAVLAPGGYLVIVDDMPEPAAAASPDLATFKAGWHAAVLWPASQFVDEVSALELECLVDEDLTPDVRPRSGVAVSFLIGLNRAARTLPFPALRQVLDSHRGGLALERLTSARLVRYRLLIARRPELQVS